MFMKLAYERAAIRGLRAAPTHVAEAQLRDLETIPAEPFGRHPQAKAFAGRSDAFRVRHGRWRAVYRIDRATDTVFVEGGRPEKGCVLMGKTERAPARRSRRRARSEAAALSAAVARLARVAERAQGAYVVLPRAEYETLLERLEDLEDAARVREAVEHPETREYLPAELVNRLMAGEHPVRIWREHRGLTVAALAEKAGVAPAYVSEIENRKKPGSVRAMKALAAALAVDLDDLVP